MAQSFSTALNIPSGAPLLNRYQQQQPAQPQTGNPALGGIFNWQNQNAGATGGMGLLKKNIGTAVNQAANAGGWLSRLFTPNKQGGGAVSNVASGSMTTQPQNVGSTPITQPVKTPTQTQVSTTGTNISGNTSPQIGTGTNISGQTGAGTTPPSPQPPTNIYGKSAQTLTDIGAGAGGAAVDTGAYQRWLQAQSLANTPAQSAIQNLQGIAQAGSPQVQQAIQNVKGLQQAQAEIATNPNIAAEVASGRGQALTGQIQAGETALQNVLTQQGQQIGAGTAAGQLGLTGQQQQLGAGEAAAGLGLTQQSQQIQAAQSAGMLVKPYQNGYVIINPQTGELVGGTGANSALNKGAQMEAQYEGAKNYATGVQKITGAKNQIDAITSLVQNKNLNPTKVNLLNSGLQEIQKNLSNEDYATLQNSLESINQAIKSITGSDIDIARLNTQEGGSLINTINNALSQAQNQNEGNLAQSGQSKGTSGGYTGRIVNGYPVDW